jgi:hypothetical protein
MSALSRALLVPAIALGVSVPAFAQPKADAGSGPTSGAISTNDAGSGPTKGGSTAASNPNNSTASGPENSAGSRPGPKSTEGAQPVTPGTSESSSQQMQTDRAPPPGDASDNRAERAMTPTPTGEAQKPNGKVGP